MDIKLINPNKNNVDIENARVLVVDDNEDILKLITIRLKPMRFKIKTATSAEEALSILATWPADLLITDLQLPGISGTELFEQVQVLNPMLPVIILTAHGTIPDAIAATEAGVASYLSKPFDGETLVKQIEIALSNTGFIAMETSDMEIMVHQDKWRSHIISKSPAMESLLTEVQKLADSPCFVVFDGEPGTGKEEIARAMYLKSNRADKVIVNFSCTSLPDDLVEFELFGDGTDERPGLLQKAAGGTLLLIDFCELPEAILKKLFHSLIAKKATSANSTYTYPIDVRLISTTTAYDSYEHMSQELSDLGNKLDLTVLSVPPLRERREDIPLITFHCLRDQFEEKELQIAKKAMHLLLEADWPGKCATSTKCG